MEPQVDGASKPSHAKQNNGHFILLDDAAHLLVEELHYAPITFELVLGVIKVHGLWGVLGDKF